jgi:hypothetical protein
MERSFSEGVGKLRLAEIVFLRPFPEDGDYATRIGDKVP